jgi:hypothetical protein
MRALRVLLGLACSVCVTGCADLLGSSLAQPRPPSFQFRTQTSDIAMLFDPWYTGPQLRQAAAALAQTPLLPSSTQAGYVLTDDDGDGDSLESFYGGKAPPPAAVPSLPAAPAAPSDATGPVARRYAQALRTWKARMTQLEAQWHERNAATTQSWERAQAAILSGIAGQWNDHGPEDMCCEDWLVGRGVQHATLSYRSLNPSDPRTISGHVWICIVFANLGHLTPSGSLPGGSLGGVHTVVVNYDGPTAPSAWKQYFDSAGAADTRIVPAPLTDAELPGALAGLMAPQTGK